RLILARNYSRGAARRNAGPPGSRACDGRNGASAARRRAAECQARQGGRSEAMSTLYVARSANTSNWASDVGLSKHVFKVGLANEAELRAVKLKPVDFADYLIRNALK